MARRKKAEWKFSRMKRGDGAVWHERGEWEEQAKVPGGPGNCKKRMNNIEVKDCKQTGYLVAMLRPFLIFQTD